MRHVVQRTLVVILQCWVADSLQLVVIDLYVALEQTFTDERLPNRKVIVVDLAEDCRFVEVNRALPDVHPAILVVILNVFVLDVVVLLEAERQPFVPRAPIYNFLIDQDVRYMVTVCFLEHREDVVHVLK